MKLEVLISTMMQDDYSLLDKMHLNSDAVVVNQCNKDEIVRFKYKEHNVIWIDSCQRGLSKSRNEALKYAQGDICLLADDDLIFRDGYKKIIIDEFQNRNVDIIRFQVEGIERTFKKYPKNAGKIGYLGALKISSVELAFRKKSLRYIFFDEKIGAGTDFLMGEENAYLYQCLHNKLKIYYVPKVISDLHMGHSSWYKGLDEEYFVGRGAAFAAMKTHWIHLLIIQFAVRKFKLYSKEISFLSAIKLMEKGRRMYDESDREE